MEYEVRNALNISYPRRAEGQLTPEGMEIRVFIMVL